MADLNTHYVSGEPNTTGREPFEDSGRNTNVGSGGYTQQLSSGIGGAGTQGFDKSQGQGHGQGLTGADTGAGFGSTGENYKNVAPGAAHAHGLGGHGHGHSHEHTSGSGLTGTTGNTGNTGASSAVGTAVGTGASEAVGGEHHSHHGHHHGHQHTADVPGPGSTKPSGEGYGGIGASDVGSHVDRVGPQGQGQAAYERTGAQGPATTGAAGTDRFDTGSTGAAHGSAENQDTSQRAPGKSSGGIGGILGTSDKDFTGRERQGGTMGAYADSDGPVEGNTSGPKGHTALTGREGNLDENPVAQAKSRGDNSTSVATATGTHGHAESEHKGLMDKVKDAFKS